MGAGWYELLDIRREVVELAELDAGTRPSACPRCGTPLEDVRGKLHCPWDGWMAGS